MPKKKSKRRGPAPGRQFDAPVVAKKDSAAEAEKRRRGDVALFIRTALERWKTASEAESEVRRLAQDDWQFSIGNQWPKDIESNRSLDGRPCLVMDQLRQSIKQVCNEQRQQRPAIQINPIGDGSTREGAEVIQGLVRHVEVVSDAEIAYDTAFEHMARCGFGFWRVITGYLPGLTFDQEILIKPIKNPFTVYWDPNGNEPDYSDKRYCFIVEDMARSEYKLKYPDSEMATLAEFTSVGDMPAVWANKDTVRVAEYFYLEDVERIILKLQDGTLRWEDELQEGEDELVVDYRKVPWTQCKWAKINAVEVMDGSEDGTEGRDFPSSYIPVQPVLGDDLTMDGKRYLAGMVRNAKDPQRMYNYWVSAATEAIALAPKAPYVGVLGQFKTQRRQWEQANVRNMPFLEYDAVPIPGGQAAPAPERNVTEAPIAAMSHMIAQAGNDVKASLGIYDASLGQRGPDQSGRAILARQKQGDVATLDFQDNLSRSMRRTGRILLDMIARVYDTARVQRIIKPDNTTQHVGIYNGKNTTKEEAEAQLLNDSIKKVYDVGMGQYDVSVSVGPSYQSRRAEMVASILELIKASPNLMAVVGDLLVQNMDWPGAQEIAKRLKKMLPPQLQDDPQDMTPEQKTMALEQQLAAMGQQLQVLQQAHAEAQKIIDTKQIEATTKIEVERMSGEIRLAVAEITSKAQETATRLKLEQDLMAKFHVSSHEAGIAAAQRAGQAALADQTHEHALAQGDQAHAHTLAQGDQSHTQAKDLSQQQADQQAAQAASDQAAEAEQAKQGGGGQ